MSAFIEVSQRLVHAVISYTQHSSRVLFSNYFEAALKPRASVCQVRRAHGLYTQCQWKPGRCVSGVHPAGHGLLGALSCGVLTTAPQGGLATGPGVLSCLLSLCRGTGRRGAGVVCTPKAVPGGTAQAEPLGLVVHFLALMCETDCSAGARRLYTEVSSTSECRCWQVC